MNRLKNQILLAAGFALLAGVISGVTAAPAIAQAIKAALIKNVDEPGRNPYTFEIQCAVSATSCFLTAPLVPANKRLVIEHISGSIDVAPGSKISDMAIVAALSPTILRRARLFPQYALTIFGKDRYVVNDPVLVYIDAADKPGIAISATLPVIEGSLTLSGYLVDLGI